MAARTPADPAKDFDAFVSYADADADVAQGFLIPALAESGLRVYTIDDQLSVPAVKAAEDGVLRSHRTIVLLSPDYLRAGLTSFVELVATQLGEESNAWPLSPVLIREIDGQPIPPRLQIMTILRATNASERVACLAALRSLLGAAAVAEPQPVPPCPYPGLLPYDEDSALPFVGREEEARQGIAALEKNPWQVVIGPSGSGKSSLVRAAILPVLASRGYRYEALRPGERPVESLNRAVHDLAAASGRPGRAAILFVDQLEEAFAGASAEQRAESRQFCHELLGAARVGRTHIIATMRADFYPQLMESPLWPVLADNRVDLGPMSVAQLRRAIRLPAESVGVLIESTLVGRLALDAADEPGALPLLQETLISLWNEIDHRFIGMDSYEPTLVLSRTTYGEAPRTALQLALSTRADATMSTLGSDQARAIARRIFVRLVQYVEGRPDVRRQQPVSALRSGEDEPAEFDRVLEVLRTAALVVSDGAPDGGEAKIDLAHETLIRSWPALAGWVSHARQAEPKRRELEQAASFWDEHQRGDAGLLDEARIKDARQWLDSEAAGTLGTSESLRALVSASREALSQSRRRRKRLRWILRGLALALAAALVAVSLYARTASQQRARANAQLRLAQSAELSLQSEALAPNLLDRELLLSIDAARLDASPRSQRAELTALNRNPLIVREIASASPIDNLAASLGTTATQPGSGFVAAGAADGSIHLLDPATGRDRANPLHVQGEVRGLSFSPDGKTVAVSNDHGDVEQFAVPSGAIIDSPASAAASHQGSSRVVRYSPNGRWLASGGIDHQIYLVDRRSGGRRVLSGARDWIEALVFTPDSKFLLSGSGATEHKSVDNRILVWDLATFRVIRTLRAGADSVRGLSLSASGKDLVAASADGIVRAWDLGSGRALWTSAASSDRVFNVAYSAQDRYVATADRVGTIRRLSAATGRPIAPPLSGHLGAVRSVMVLQDGTLLSGGSDGRVIVWAPEQPERARLVSPVGAPENAPAVALDAGLGLSAIGYDNGRVVIRDHNGAAVGRALDTGAAPVVGLAFMANHLLVSSTYDGRLEIWDPRSERSVAGPVLGAGIDPRIAVAPSGGVIATGGADGAIRLWSPSLQSLTVGLTGHTGAVTGLTFASDSVLVSASEDLTLRAWTRISATLGSLPPDGRVIATGTAGFTSVALAPDRRTIAAGNHDGNIVFLDLGDHNVGVIGRPTLSGHTADVTFIGFTPAGTTLVSADGTGVVRLWSMAGERTPIGVVGTSGPVSSGTLSGSGLQLITAGRSGELLWNLDPATWPNIACAVAGRNLRADEIADYERTVAHRTATCPDQPTPTAVPAPSESGGG